MATQNFINECKNRANANRLAKFNVKNWDRFDLKIKGNTYQQTYTGKNLCGIPDLSVTKSGVAITIKNGEITLNGTASAGITQYLTPINTTTLSGNYSLNVIYLSGSTGGSSNKNFNVRRADNNNFIFNATYKNNNEYNTYNFTSSTQIIFGIYIADGSTFTNYKFKPQLVSGTSSDYDYEPYVGGTVSPNPNYPQNIVNVTGLQRINITGKNLIKNTNVNSGDNNYWQNYSTFDEATGELTRSTTATSESYITHKLDGVKSNTKYTISFYAKSNGYVKNMDIYLFNKNTKGIKTLRFINLTTDFKKYVFTFTTDSDIDYSELASLRIDNNGSTESGTEATLTIKNVMLAEGEDSEFEPYTGNSYEVNLGKNLFNINGSFSTGLIKYNNGFQLIKNSTNRTTNYFPASPIPAGTYTLSYTIVSSTLSNITKCMVQAYSSNTQIATKQFSNDGYITFTTTDDITKLYFYVSNSEETDAQITLDNIQLEKGSTATSYSPYFTPIELNKIGDYEDSIKKSTGKNLFDKNNADIINAYFEYNNVGSLVALTQPDDRTLIFKCEPNTTYTISKVKSLRFRVASYGSRVTSGQLNNGIYNNSGTSITITTGNSDYYIYVHFWNKGDTLTEQQILDSIMINEGSTALPYEPYGKVWYIEKNVGKIVLDGTERDSVYSLGSSGNFTRIGYIPFNDTSVVKSQCDYVSNYYKYLGAIGGDTTSEGISNTSASGLNRLFIFINSSTANTIATFKTWLTTHNTEIKYIMATPIYEVITNEELINQLNNIKLLNGINNVTVNNNLTGVDITYWNKNVQVDEDEIYYEINQTNYLKKIELKDSCYVNNEFLGSIYTKSVETELLNLPVNIELVGKTITPDIGVKYADTSTEYITFDDYVIESVKDEQTASNTSFSAMNGSTLLDKEYICSLSFEGGQTHTINEFYQDACSQIGLTPTDETFDNSEIVMTGNPFTNKETIRTVLSEIEKVSCSIIKFDWTNKTISLTWLSNQIDYEFNTSDYSTLEGSMEQYGPLNVIIIANAQLNGENVVMTDEESVAEYGEHQIIIDSPYFLYTEELRTQAIQAIYDKLDGLTYYDLKLTTPYGKPFLNIGDKIRINTNENQVYDTYVLSHTFTYDGTFQSIIESPALTQEEQTIKNEFKGNSVREKLRRTELMVDKTTGEITAIAQRVSEVETKTEDNYTKEEINELILNVEGTTNKLINSGGNNIFRNTGLWFEDTSNIEYLYPSNTLYPSDELYMLAEPYFEYWQGKVVRMAEDKAANLNALLLQNTTLSQKQQVRNGSYTISFKYKKLIQLSTASVTINGETISLEENEGEFVKTIDITSQYINISFLCDTDNGVEIYDLMGNVGEEKAEYSQHQNETTTDTVNISKGITITSSDTNTTFKANSDGIRVYNSRDLENPVTKYTDTGTNTKKIEVENEATIVEVLFKKVGNNTWLTKL